MGRLLPGRPPDRAGMKLCGCIVGQGGGNGMGGGVRVSVQLGLNCRVGAREADRGATDEPPRANRDCECCFQM